MTFWSISKGVEATIHCSAQIDSSVRIGRRVSIGPGTRVHGEVLIEDSVVIDKGVTIGVAGDPRPIRIGAGSILGERAHVNPGTTIGHQVLVESDSQVVGAVEPYTHFLMSGNTRIRSEGVVPYGANLGLPISVIATGEANLGVQGAGLVRITDIREDRGRLLAAEIPNQLPFHPRRVFFVKGAPPYEARGIHAHRRCQQLLICIEGSVHCIVADGKKSACVILDDPGVALHMKSRVWGTQFNFSSDAVLMVIASEIYEQDDYIHYWADFASLQELG